MTSRQVRGGMTPGERSQVLDPDCYLTRTSPNTQAEGDGASPDHHLDRKKVALVGKDRQPYPPQPEGSLWRDKVDDAPLKRLSDAELQRKRAFAQRAQMKTFGGAETERLQDEIDEIDAEQRRRLRRLQP